MHLLVALMFALSVHAAPVCTIGSGSAAWSGSPAELATIEAVHQQREAEKAHSYLPN